MKKYFYSLGLLICFLFMISCKMEIDNIVRDKIIVSITVDATKAEQTEYLVNTKLNTNGIEVYAHYSDGTDELINNALVEFDELQTGTEDFVQKVEVRYKGFTAYFDVQILMSSITGLVIKPPYKRYYKQDPNAKFDDTGMYVYAKYSTGELVQLEEGEYEILDFDCTYITPDFAEATVVLKNNPKIFEKLTYVVFTSDISGINIKNQPYRTVFLQSEPLDFSGIEIGLLNSKGETKGELVFKSLSVSIMGRDEKGEKIDLGLDGSDLSSLKVGETYTVHISASENAGVDIDISITDCYVNGLKLNDEQFVNLFYEGDEINLEKQFSYQKKIDNGSADNIPLQEGNMITKNCEEENINYSFLKYSYNVDVGFDDANDVFNTETQTLKLEESGNKIIYFYYKYYNLIEHDFVVDTVKKNIAVGDSPISSLEAKFNFDSNFKGFPLGVEFNDAEYKDYWTITAKTSSKKNSELKIDPVACTFEMVGDDSNSIYKKIASSENKYCNVKVKVIYNCLRRDKTFGSIESNVVENIKVIDKEIKSVNIMSCPIKTEYFESEELDLSGFRAEILYSYGMPDFCTDSENTDKYKCYFINNGTKDREYTSENKYIKNGDSGILIVFTDVHGERRSEEYSFNIKTPSIEKLEISYKTEENNRLRKCGDYSDDEFRKLFKVIPIYNNENKNNLTDVTEKTHFILWKNGTNYELRAIYNEDGKERIGILKEPNLKMCSSLPVKVDVVLNNTDKFVSLNKSMYEKTTVYSVTFKDDDTVNFNGSDINGNTNEYTDLKYGTFKIDIDEGSDAYKITYTPKETAYNENNLNLIFNVPVISGIRLELIYNVSETPKFFAGVDYDFNYYFNVYVIYSNGTKRLINNDIHFVLVYDKDAVHNGEIVDAKIHAIFNSKADTYSVKVYPPLLSSIDIIDNSSSKLNIQELKKFPLRLIYEDGYFEVIRNDVDSKIYDIKRFFNNEGSIYNSFTIKATLKENLKIYEVSNVEKKLEITYNKLSGSISENYKDKTNYYYLSGTNDDKLKSVCSMTREYSVKGFLDKNNEVYFVDDATNSCSYELTYNNSDDFCKTCKGNLVVTDLEKVDFNYEFKDIYIVPEVVGVSLKDKLLDDTIIIDSEKNEDIKDTINTYLKSKKYIIKIKTKAEERTKELEHDELSEYKIQYVISNDNKTVYFYYSYWALFDNEGNCFDDDKEKSVLIKTYNINIQEKIDTNNPSSNGSSSSLGGMVNGNNTTSSSSRFNNKWGRIL